MEYLERIGCIHIHTTFSDGSAKHHEIARLAARAGLDYLIVTDHNTYVPEYQGWYSGARKISRQGIIGGTLLLVGEEVHDPAHSQANHYLAFNAGEELRAYADGPGQLVAAVRERGGLGFIAHPYEHSGAYSHEDEINWVDWRVVGYTGLEIWNYMSEFKAYLPNLPVALLYAYAPRLAITGPFPETLVRWDGLLGQRKVVALGGVDAHAHVYQVGPLKRQVFGYEHLFRTVTTHLLLAEPWNGQLRHDGGLVYEALAAGRAFVAYEALASARSFSFTAEQGSRTFTLGDELPEGRTTRFRVQTPVPAHLRLVLNGFCVAEATASEMVYESRVPGAYRVEAYRRYAFKERGWVFTNPIYIKSETGHR